MVVVLNLVVVVGGQVRFVVIRCRCFGDLCNRVFLSIGRGCWQVFGPLQVEVQSGGLAVSVVRYLNQLCLLTIRTQVKIFIFVPSIITTPIQLALVLTESRDP